MIRLTAFADHTAAVDDTLSLPFEKRQKRRQRVRLVSGQDAGLVLPRGTVLRGGDCLLSDDGQVVRVTAEAEPTSRVVSDDPLLLLRAAYHLGNRHVPLQVDAATLRYLQDHVLDDMVRQLGLDVVHEAAPFEPEQGAYAHPAHHPH